MAPSTIINNTVQGDTFLLGQIFVFGGFALRPNSLGQLEQIDSFALATDQVRKLELHDRYPRRLDLRRIRVKVQLSLGGFGN